MESGAEQAIHQRYADGTDEDNGPDLPCEDDSADLHDYADTVVDAIGDRGDLVVVGQSYGGFTALLPISSGHRPSSSSPG